VAGAILSIPIFYLVFLKVPASDLLATELSVPYEMNAEKYPMPAATTWKAVADVLAEGVENIKISARWAALAGILVGLALEITRIVTNNRFPLSPMAIGLGFIIPFNTCLSMFVGSFLFWAVSKLGKESRTSEIAAENQEPICAGLIAGGALMGIAVAVADLFLPAPPH